MTRVSEPRLLLLAALLLGAAGCDRSTTLPVGETPITRAEMELLAPAFDEFSAGIADAQVAGSWLGDDALAADGRMESSFDGVRRCPAGGEVRYTGTVRRDFDARSRSMTLRMRATKTAADCAFARREGGTLTIDGNPNIAVEVSRHLVERRPSGPQTATHRGSFRWMRGTGESGSCTVDLVSTFDPASRTHTVQGSFCGHTVDRRR
jgi:hypothetical protein